MIDAELRSALKTKGATLVGVGDLSEVPASVRYGLPYGVSIAVALRREIIAGILLGPTREYYAEYTRANALLDSLGIVAANFLQSQGFVAKAFPATNWGIDPATHSTQLPHKTVATRAGLGWIGKCALLITEPFGAAVRITTVLTDAPLPCGEPVNESRCGGCTACVEICPGHAATGEDWRLGLHRGAFFDAFACRKTARELAAKHTGIVDTKCGMCIAACPWTQRYIEPALDL